MEGASAHLSPHPCPPAPKCAGDGPTALVRVGDPTPVGEIASIDGITVVGDEVVFSARLVGDGARRALLAVAAR